MISLQNWHIDSKAYIVKYSQNVSSEMYVLVDV